MEKFIKNLIKECIEEIPLSEGLTYHLTCNRSISKPIFRPGTQKFFDLIKETRSLWQKKLVEVHNSDLWILEELDIGEWGVYNGQLVPLDFPALNTIVEADYKGREVELNKPFRVSGGNHKFAVYVKDPKTKKVKKVQFGSPGLKVKLKDPKRRKSFAARHRCEQKDDKTTPGYWACRISRYPELFGGDDRYQWW